MYLLGRSGIRTGTSGVWYAIRMLVIVYQSKNTKVRAPLRLYCARNGYEAHVTSVGFRCVLFRGVPQGPAWRW